MATYNVGIGKEDIQQPVLLPEDWYMMELQKDSLAKNNAWKTAGEHLPLDQAIQKDPKAGENLVLQLKVVSDTPEFSGRYLTKYLPWPNPHDEGQFTGRGQPKGDAKAEVIYTWVKALSGLAEGQEISLAPGQKCLVYIVQEKDQNGQLTNSIAMNVAPRQLGSSDLDFTNNSDPLGIL